MAISESNHPHTPSLHCETYLFLANKVFIVELYYLNLTN